MIAIGSFGGNLGTSVTAKNRDRLVGHDQSAGKIRLWVVIINHPKDFPSVQSNAKCLAGRMNWRRGRGSNGDLRGIFGCYNGNLSTSDDIRWIARSAGEFR